VHNSISTCCDEYHGKNSKTKFPACLSTYNKSNESLTLLYGAYFTALWLKMKIMVKDEDNLKKNLIT